MSSDAKSLKLIWYITVLRINRSIKNINNTGLCNCFKRSFKANNIVQIKLQTKVYYNNNNKNGRGKWIGIYTKPKTCKHTFSNDEYHTKSVKNAVKNPRSSDRGFKRKYDEFIEWYLYDGCVCTVWLWLSVGISGKRIYSIYCYGF